MPSKTKSNVDLEPRTTPVQRETDVQHQTDDTSICYAPSQEEIRRRAYEIYLERGALPGNEIDDWHRAERELQKVALFARDWNRIQQRVAPASEAAIDVRPVETPMKTKERGNQ
jgi:hypothetical protein